MYLVSFPVSMSSCCKAAENVIKEVTAIGIESLFVMMSHPCLGGGGLVAHCKLEYVNHTSKHASEHTYSWHATCFLCKLSKLM